MKVLFAVSNEEISETIVKKYQSMYKQIISYKNVYYFNAILKELQKDKSYDRIVISEDLEAFTHTQYDQIDKFIFEKLDSISDEASNNRGNDTPIILICSERRTKSEQILVKLFGIGIYNAIIGNDRSTEEVCKLINRPRTKKEAKTYYKIDVEDVNYQAESENDVSEMEIQNILAHYKRLGKNEDRYIESFNNIAAQYNDTQLRIITKFLPLNVRAVLEESSPKYQQIMSFNNSVSNDLRTKNKQKENEGTSEILLKSENRETIMSKPVVIPRAVNMKGIKKLAKPQQNVEHVAKEVTYTGEQHLQQRNEHKNIEPEQTQNVREIKEEVVEQEEPKPVKRGRGRPRKNAVPEVQNTAEQPVKRKRGRPRKNPIEEPKTVESIEVQQEEPIVPGFEDIDDETKVKQEENYNDTILPGFEETDEKEDTFLPGFDDTEPEPIKEPEKSTILPGFEDEQEQNYGNYRYEAPQQNKTEYKTLENENTQQNETNENNEYSQNNISYNSRTQEYNYTNNEQEEEEYESTIDLTNLLTPDKKIVSFIGTSKNGTSFIVNNLAEQMAKIGINTAILDTTKNRNSYYIYTKNEEQLRQAASKSIDGLAVGITNGINVEKNLTVYTSLPNENGSIKNVDKILETLIKNYSLVLIDTDFNTPKGYFKQSQETYLVQTMDILTIQPLTAFLKELKARNILDEKKLRIILNKVVKIRGIKDETIIGGMAFYNDPSMSFMTELFDRTRIKYISIPFEEETYIRYLEGIIKCEISLKGYSKAFLQSLKELGNMVYPLVSSPKDKNTYRPPSVGENNFSPNMNNTLDKMKRNF